MVRSRRRDPPDDLTICAEAFPRLRRRPAKRPCVIPGGRGLGGGGQSWDCITLAFPPNLLRIKVQLFFLLLVKGGLGGPVSVECTREPCLSRSIEEVDGAAASPVFTVCRFRTSLRANGEATDDAEVLRPTPPWRGGRQSGPPPLPPLHKGGKRKQPVRNKKLLSRSTFRPGQLQLCTTPGLG